MPPSPAFPALAIRSDVPLAAIGRALERGTRAFGAALGVSVAYAGLFVFVGTLALAGVAWIGLTPFMLPLAGGFMLLGPALLAGFFSVGDVLAAGGRPRLSDVARGFARAPAALWAIAALCMLLFMVWITDAGILYGFMVGEMPGPLAGLFGGVPAAKLLAFEFYGALLGSALAFALYAVSAFSVPLVYDRRAGLVQAVSASVRAVFSNPVTASVWGLLLAGVTLTSILLLPLLLLTLPVLAYASRALYQEFFPPSA
jgi:uncharacterized membrane protein